MATKYQGINIVNVWRQYGAVKKQKLPNWNAINTIYYDKLSIWLRTKNLVDYDFALGAYLYELDLTTAKELNNLTIDTKKDEAIMNNIFATHRLIENAVLQADQPNYDSGQADLYGHDEWYLGLNPKLEDDVLKDTNYSSSNQTILENKRKKELERITGQSNLSPAKNLYGY